MKRIRIDISGTVQGVGFRPFVYRLARELDLAGWVRNTPAGVELEAEGNQEAVKRLLERLPAEAPPLALVARIDHRDIPVVGDAGFGIAASGAGAVAAEVPPDADVCPDCLRELFDPGDRRYRYPFITCTNCGPRYSIITGIPYDRPRTTMAGFPLCPACAAEYHDPADRRFHAQPVACPDCGPCLRLVNREGHELEVPGDASLRRAAELLRSGRIVAVKGIGGFHLAVDATGDIAVAELRRRKQRDEKPFALMAADLAEIGRHALLTPAEERLLSGPERPVVLLPRRPGEETVSRLVAPANGYLGFMLPAAPLHHLLLRELDPPLLVMTSGNVSDEPIAFEDDDAQARLASIADAFLVHDRPIRTRADDSVIRNFHEGPLFLRRGRGYVPRGVTLPAELPPVLAVGAELKSTVCLVRGDRAYLSQHLGDLKSAAVLASMDDAVRHLSGLLEVAPGIVAHDLHPDYLSTGYAEEIAGVKRVAVQHHHAHLASCMAENGLAGEAIGVIFDGSGYGPDGTVWGGEFLVGGYGGFRRAGHLRQVPLPGGDAAVKEPYRMALAYLFDALGGDPFRHGLPCCEETADADRDLFRSMLERRINSPLTSSCGRLFDAVAALAGVRQRVSYEGQAAMELEGLADGCAPGDWYPYQLVRSNGTVVVDFRPLIQAVAEDAAAGEKATVIARRFHDTLARAVADTCTRIAGSTGLTRVVLSGGVFQNRLLAEGVHRALTEAGLEVFVHRLVPPNDGGIALGQAVVAGYGAMGRNQITE